MVGGRVGSVGGPGVEKGVAAGKLGVIDVWPAVGSTGFGTRDDLDLDTVQGTGGLRGR